MPPRASLNRQSRIGASDFGPGVTGGDGPTDLTAALTPTPTPTVYVIDDDDAVRNSLLFLLNVDGLHAQGFASAQACLAGMPPAASGCIVTDLHMPGVNGADLMRLLPEHGIHLPVIVVTGHRDIEAMPSGAFALIEKPTQDATILNAVRTALAIGSDPSPLPPRPVQGHFIFKAS